MTRADEREERRADRKETLSYALPYLLFLVFPLWGVFTAGLGQWPNWMVGIIVIALAGVYVTAWIVSPIAPRDSQSGPGYLICTTGIVLLAGAACVLAGRQIPELIFLFTFAASPLALLAPQRLVGIGLAALGLVVVAAGTFIGASFSLLITGIVAVAGTGGVCWISRLGIVRQRDRDQTLAQLHQLSQERQRNHIASELHDVLGQDLTGLAIKADLITHLLDGDRIDAAKREADEVAALARSALADVRTIVSQTREWMLEREVENARTLLESSGIKVHIDAVPTERLDPVTSAMARVVRESTTNILLHARAANSWITISENSVLVRNDGYSPRLSERTAGSQQGLVGLEETLRDTGRLFWNPQGNEWVVKFEV